MGLFFFDRFYLILSQFTLKFLDLLGLGRAHFFTLFELVAFLNYQFFGLRNFPTQELKKCYVEPTIPFSKKIFHHFLDSFLPFFFQHLL